MKRSWVGDYISNGWIRKCEWRLHACSVSRLGNIPAATWPKPTHHQIKCIRFFLFFVHRLKIISFPFLCVVFCMYNSTMYIVHLHSNWSLQLNDLQFIFSQYERRQISSYLFQRSVSGSVTIGQSGCMTVWPLLCSCVNQGFDLSYLPPILPNWRNCYCKLPFRKLMGTAS